MNSETRRREHPSVTPVAEPVLILVRISRLPESRTGAFTLAEFEIESVDQADSLCLVLDNGDIAVLIE